MEHRTANIFLILVHAAVGVSVEYTRFIRHWPNGTVPVLIEPEFSPIDRQKLYAAMSRWEAKTCVQFVQWEEGMTIEGTEAYVRFNKGRTCFSKSGMHHFQPQGLGLANACMSIPIISHEIGHALGMLHTMERNDRDYYINILYDNIKDGSYRNFQTTDMSQTYYNFYDTPYDYKSVMHYGPKVWGKQNNLTMISKDIAYQDVMGKVKEISFYDAMYINSAYNCSEKCPNADTIQCKNGGFVGGPRCNCICPDGYDGEFCDVPLTGYQHIVDWRCQNDWVYHSGKCYLFEISQNVSFQTAEYECTNNNNANLATFKTESEARWLLGRLREVVATTSASSFWVGLTRNASDPTYMWIDDTLYNDTIMPVHDLAPSQYRACGTTNGEILTMEACEESQVQSSTLCVKDFDPHCGGRYIVSSTGLTIQTPGYPETDYPRDIRCQYILQTSKNKKIEIMFTKFALEYSTSCRKDYLEIMKTDQGTTDGKKYCGSSLNGETVTSSDNLAVLTFKSNRLFQNTGFSATARAVPKRSDSSTTRSATRMLDAFRKFMPTGSLDSAKSSTYFEGVWNIIKAMTASHIL